MPSPDSDLSPRYYTFWSINGPLDRARLRRQLADFKSAGLHGVVFHPRFYPGIPPYLSPAYLAEVSACILHAKELGLRFWLYDENGWPSGTGDGRGPAKFPDSGAMRLDLTREATPASLGCFRTVREVPGRPFVWLTGAFTLLRRSPFTGGPNGTVRTDGPFVAGINPVVPTGEFTSGGLPSCNNRWWPKLGSP